LSRRADCHREGNYRVPRFVVLYHELPEGSARASHWDLMLEQETGLRTWALAELPAPGINVPCEALAEHRLEYLDYEGPVSNGRGSVRRIDRGTYRVVSESADELRLEMCGERFVGHLRLVRKPDVANKPGQPHNWVARFTLPGSDA
jgi:hypothetical protein